jgi:hypothetical protein
MVMVVMSVVRFEQQRPLVDPRLQPFIQRLGHVLPSIEMIDAFFAMKELRKNVRFWISHNDIVVLG